MLSWDTQQDGYEQRITMKGHLSEETPLEPLAQEISSAHVVFDLAGIVRVNSIGCRQWLKMVQALAARGISIVLERCSVPIVQQLTMIAGFEGNGRVRSFYIPLYCEACEHEMDQLVTLESGVQEVLMRGEVCPSCAAHMQLDDLPECYEGLTGLLERLPPESR